MPPVRQLLRSAAVVQLLISSISTYFDIVNFSPFHNLALLSNRIDD